METVNRERCEEYEGGGDEERKIWRDKMNT